ncbi:MAG TPA: histidine phosphatase family protein [Candidatus Limnocylindrales bacterium]
MTRADPRHRIWLIRHAPTTWTGRRWCGRADPPLSTAGRRAAADLARDLGAKLPGDAVVLTSPARRARATAEAVASRGALELVVADELLEVDVGRVEGLDWGELSTLERATAEAIVGGRPIDWPGGESAVDVDARAQRAARRVRTAARARPVVVVSHGAFLAALARALGLPAAGIGMDPCAVVRLDP